MLCQAPASSGYPLSIFVHICLPCASLLPVSICVCNICEMQSCQIAFLLQCCLLRRLCNVITNHTWRASWHSHKVRMKYEDDYGDPRLYYRDFLIIASLIYFCLLSLSLPCSLYFFTSSNRLPVAHAEVEQKGKSIKHTCKIRVNVSLFDTIECFVLLAKGHFL